MASETHRVVVLGANFAGVSITHHLQRQVIPVLQRLDSGLSYHITIVSPNTHCM
jgi:NADH dehydrogenase FAD-containing subunit